MMLKLNAVTTGISNVVNMKLEDAYLSVDVLEVKRMTNHLESGTMIYKMGTGRQTDRQGRV